ncbi:MYB transcription factor, partial [Trifolium pratense]
MQDMKKQHNQNQKQKQLLNEESKKKERHIVTWTQEEDDILRDQIGIHGTENWAIIASKFKDKTTRQCRRRWYTYLNSDFKKGGWSPEEDMLLCECEFDSVMTKQVIINSTPESILPPAKVKPNTLKRILSASLVPMKSHLFCIKSYSSKTFVTNKTNPSSIPGGNNSWPDFTYLVAELWITKAPSPGNQRAQKIFGNRWTEIAKVVSGRTDNAVKNRFSTLCKKRAKYEALAKENNVSYTNSNNKRIIFRDAESESAVDFKK